MIMDHLKEALTRLENKGRLRSLSSAQGVDFTSNDYLGFATHPELVKAGELFFSQGGAVGSAASRLLHGYMDEHFQLEAYAADYFEAPASLFFSTGFQANMALMSALAQRGDAIIFDSLIHASSRDGIQASLAKHYRAAHNDLNAYEEALKKAREAVKGQLWVAVEAVYSMDGDDAPLDELYTLCQHYGATLIIDEAHGVGVCGATGKGVSEALVKTHGYDGIICVHTCGKALGAAGGLVCASKSVIEYLVNTARGFIYTTAPMPIQAHMVRCALELLQTPQGQRQRQKLFSNCAALKTHLGGLGSHIVPVVIGEDQCAVNISDFMRDRGYDVRAIRPPTVPHGSARLRVSLNADLSVEEINGFCDALSEARSVIEGKAA